MMTMTNGIKKSVLSVKFPKREEAHFIFVHLSVLYEDGTRKRSYEHIGIRDDIEDVIKYTAEFYKDRLSKGLLDKVNSKAVSFRLNRVDGIRPRIKEYHL